MPSARAAGTQTSVITTSMVIKMASVTGDNPPLCGDHFVSLNRGRQKLDCTYDDITLEHLT
jgi:hypothetical protein